MDLREQSPQKDPPVSGNADGRTLVPTETLREWIAACNPFEAVDTTDRRYFDLDKPLESGGTLSLRGDYQVEWLFDPIDLIDESCQLLSGFR